MKVDDLINRKGINSLNMYSSEFKHECYWAIDETARYNNIGMNRIRDAIAGYDDIQRSTLCGYISHGQSYISDNPQSINDVVNFLSTLFNTALYLTWYYHIYSEEAEAEQTGKFSF